MKIFLTVIVAHALFLGTQGVLGNPQDPVPSAGMDAQPQRWRDNYVRRMTWRPNRQNTLGDDNSLRQRRANSPWRLPERNWTDMHRENRRSAPNSIGKGGTVTAGYVFIDGSYHAPPYRIIADADRLTINDVEINLPPSPPAEANRRVSTSPQRWGAELMRALQRESIVVVSNDSTSPKIAILPVFETGTVFLKQIAGVETDQQTAKRSVLQAASWLPDYQPSPDLLARVKQDLDRIERAKASVQVKAPATSLGRWVYPLTAGGMFFVAVAIGQLVVSRSLLAKEESIVSAETMVLAKRCIVFTVALSLVDLVCTLVAAQAGVMYETNPLASQFLSSPTTLIALKVSVTLFGAALLYALRSHFPARRAAWWLCLVCTLVVLRWVAFQSLLVS